MIIDHDEHIVICTPTKCGKTSLEAMARAAVHADMSRNLEVVRPGQHRLDVPKQAEGYTRMMMVRDPWARLVSTWSFLSNPGSKGEQNAALIRQMSFTEFVYWWLAQRKEALHNRPWVKYTPKELWSAPARWLMTLSECADIWQPEHCLDVANIENSLFEHGLDYGPDKKNNSSDRVRPGHWTDYYTHSTFNKVSDAFAIKEADRFGFIHTMETVHNSVLSGKYADKRISDFKEEPDGQGR